jgi:hypothetical protein
MSAIALLHPVNKVALDSTPVSLSDEISKFQTSLMKSSKHDIANLGKWVYFLPAEHSILTL